MEQEAEKLLKKYFGYESFRTGQKEIISEILKKNDVVAIMPTGAGKSICYQIPAMLFPGITIVVSPLISLMRDQVCALIEIGVRGAYLNSSLTERQMQKAIANAKLGMYKIIYVAPERLNMPSFLDFAKNAEISLLAVDEAHCISQWGHDFRQSYTKIPEFIQELPRRPVVAAFTATATKQVKRDIVISLKLSHPFEMVTGYDRPNLFFSVYQPLDKSTFILNYLKKHKNRTGIVYCMRKKVVDDLTDELKENGITAVKYHAGMSAEERKKSQDQFLFDRCQVMVATNAFGMGIDKSNVSFVIHFHMPMNIEQYYQEAGRAGRDGSSADCILLYGKADVRLGNFLIDCKIEAAEDLTQEQKKIIRDREEEKLKMMTYYSTTHYCLRRYLLSYFGESAPWKCGSCSNCCGIDQRTFLSRPSTEGPEKEFSAQTKFVFDDELFEELKNLRKQLARRQGIPAYLIFSDAVLQRLLHRRPKTLSEMKEIEGIGEKKLTRYGALFLEIIQKHEEK